MQEVEPQINLKQSIASSAVFLPTETAHNEPVDFIHDSDEKQKILSKLKEDIVNLK